LKSCTISKYAVETAWNSKAFGIETYELHSISKEILDEINVIPGHYSIKVDPISSKKLLHEYGFYYCDTQVEPFCTPEQFISFEHEDVSISRTTNLEDFVDIAKGAFFHSRWNRDFHLNPENADGRFVVWLKELYKEKSILALMFQDKLAGFWGSQDNRIILHAVNTQFRGRRLAKYLWSQPCKGLFEKGHSEITSSISMSNVSALNLYASLGFRFRYPLDVYHRMVQ
jgi:ribosomal protein S18 acetylase RimI-like enzyme